MKITPIHPVGVLSFLLFAPLLWAQTSPVPHAANPASDVNFIAPPTVAPFTPPNPKAPLPPVEVVRRRQITTADGGSLVVEKIKPPLTAAPPKPQRPPLDPVLAAQLRAEWSAWRKDHPLIHLSFSATVYDHMYTHLQWWHDKRFYQAWSNIDFTLLSGLGNFQQGNTTYELFFIPDNKSTRPVTGPDGKIHPAPKLPDIPELPSTPAFVITEGDESDTGAIAGIQALHDLWLKERAAITKFHADRAQYFKDHQAWQNAHPPGPENNTVRYHVERHNANPPDAEADAQEAEVAP
jgi:hypothetical protein